MGEGFRRVLGDHVDIGANEAHVIQTGTEMHVYGTNLDDNIAVTQNQVTIDRIGSIPIDGSSISEMTVDTGGGVDNVEATSSTSFQVNDVNPPQQGIPNGWQSVNWKYDPTVLTFATVPPGSTVLLPENGSQVPVNSNPFLTGFVNSNFLHTVFEVGWNVDPKKFIDANGQLRANSIMIVQIVKETGQWSRRGNYTLDWHVDSPGGLNYPVPSAIWANSTTKVDLGGGQKIQVLSESDTPGADAYQEIPGQVGQGDRFIHLKQEFETYVIAVTGREGLELDSYNLGEAGRITWLRSATVYAGVKWHAEYNIVPGTIDYTFNRAIDDPAAPPSDTFKEVMWDYFFE